MWKMCFSSEGCVAYARRCEAKALRAISAFCRTYPSIGGHIERLRAHLFPMQAPPFECQLNLRRAILVLPTIPTETCLQDFFHSHSFERVACATFSGSTRHSRLDPFDPCFLARRNNRPCLPTTTRACCTIDTMYVFSSATFRWEIILDDG